MLLFISSAPTLAQGHILISLRALPEFPVRMFQAILCTTATCDFSLFNGNLITSML